MGNSNRRKRVAKVCWEENVPSTFVCGQCTQRSACIHCAWRLPNTCPLCRFEGSSHLQPPRGQGRGILDLRPPHYQGTRQRNPQPTTPTLPGDEAEESSTYDPHTTRGRGRGILGQLPPPRGPGRGILGQLPPPPRERGRGILGQ